MLLIAFCFFELTPISLPAPCSFFQSSSTALQAHLSVFATKSEALAAIDMLGLGTATDEELEAMTKEALAALAADVIQARRMCDMPHMYALLARRYVPQLVLDRWTRSQEKDLVAGNEA